MSQSRSNSGQRPYQPRRWAHLWTSTAFRLVNVAILATAVAGAGWTLLDRTLLDRTLPDRTLLGTRAGALLGLALVGGAVAAAVECTLRAAARTREAEDAASGMRNLHELTRRTLEMNLHQEPGGELARLVQEIFQLDAVAVFDADLHEVYEAGDWKTNPRDLAQNIYYFETSNDDPATGISRRVVRLGSAPVGSLVLRGATLPLVNSAIAALIGVTFDRYRATANESRIEAERHAEQMRTTVLDNLAHAYKTPLTAIRAASSGLTEMGQLSPAQAGLVNLIDEQATLLSELTGKLLITASLEAGDPQDRNALALHTEPESAVSLLEDAVEAAADWANGIEVRIDVPEQDLMLDCDRRLVGMLLTQYLDNARKYADAETVVTARAARLGQEAVFSVHSIGPVIPPADRERIFDRYYRAANASQYATGTGVGLSIAKRVALVHGGSVWVASDEAEGTTFFAALPVERKARSQEASGPTSMLQTAQDRPGARQAPHEEFERSTR